MADYDDTDDDGQSDDKLLAQARRKFKRARDAEDDNRKSYIEDIRFARLGEQWPETIAKQRALEGRPMLTVNRLPTVIRQVVNDARQNKPSIKAMPVDSAADIETADIINGLVRNIEATSSADIAYDTGIECAVGGGIGYWRIGLDFAHDDTFDLDLRIEEIANPLSVYGDPDATSKDGSDWMCGFIVEPMPKDRFEAQYPDAEAVSFDADEDQKTSEDNDDILVAEYWHREEIEREIVRLTDGQIVPIEKLEDEEFQIELAVAGVTALGATRKVKSFKVRQYILSGAEVLSRRDWPGRFIPIVPVYGDEVNEDGKRHFRSLIRDAIDPQRMVNFWHTAATELVALAPRVPYIGPKGTFSGVDAEKWATVNTESHPNLEYEDKGTPPQRQLMDASAAGAIQQALIAADNIKATTGIYDASLGARSNETSGRAILARQREGDVSTFHFIDNLTRSIRHSGRILIDLIPHVYNAPRVARLMGEDNTVKDQPINQPIPMLGPNGEPQMEPVPGMPPGPDGQPLQRPVMRIYDLTAGKYDLTATAGPSFTTRREEAATQMMELLRAFPDAAPFIGDLFAKNLDWPGADEIAKRLQALIPQGAGGGLPPEVEKMIEEGRAQLEKLTAENQALKADQAVKMAELEIKRAELQIKAKELQIKEFKAETDRLEAMKPEPAPANPAPRPRAA